MEESELEELVRRAQTGDKAAQNELLDEHKKLLKERATFECKRAGLGLSYKDDVIQEASTAIVKRLPTLEWRGTKAFQGWVKKEVQGAASDLAKAEFAKKRDRRVTAGGDALKNTRAGIGPVTTDVNHRILNLAHSFLPFEQARVITMMMKGYSYKEIAKVLERTDDAVRKLAERANAELQRRLRKEEDVSGSAEYLDNLYKERAEKRQEERELNQFHESLPEYHEALLLEDQKKT